MLHEMDVSETISSAGELNRDLWHAALEYPRACPSLHIALTGGLKGADEVCPLGVGIGMLLEVEAEAVAEVLIAEEVVELLQDGWGLLVDDGSVGAFGILEVGDVLVDGGGALGLVDGVGEGFDLFVEVLPGVVSGLSWAMAL